MLPNEQSFKCVTPRTVAESNTTLPLGGGDCIRDRLAVITNDASSSSSDDDSGVNEESEG